MRFSSPHHAFAYAFEILDVWRAGKGFDPDPDRLGGGGTGVLGAVNRAIDIMAVADRHDPGVLRQKGRIDRDQSWFFLIYIDQPNPRNWTEHEKWYLDRAVCSFCEELSRLDLCERNGCRGECNK